MLLDRAHRAPRTRSAAPGDRRGRRLTSPPTRVRPLGPGAVDHGLPQGAADPAAPVLGQHVDLGPADVEVLAERQLELGDPDDLAALDGLQPGAVVVACSARSRRPRRRSKASSSACGRSARADRSITSCHAARARLVGRVERPAARRCPRRPSDRTRRRRATGISEFDFASGAAAWDSDASRKRLGYGRTSVAKDRCCSADPVAASPGDALRLRHRRNARARRTPCRRGAQAWFEQQLTRPGAFPDGDCRRRPTVVARPRPAALRPLAAPGPRRSAAAGRSWRTTAAGCSCGASAPAARCSRR